MQMSHTVSSCDNDLWSFAVTIYSAPGVAEECLELQDRCDADVNILLFCAWIAWSRKIALTSEDFEAMNALVGPWRESVVKPIRSTRRYMKGAPDDDILALRTRVKAVELEAERIELGMLYSYAEDRWSHAGDAPVSIALRSNCELFLQKQNPAGDIREDDPVRCLTAAVLALDSGAVRE
jgi:uncharacterized protein (TIGR02444 family)